MSEQVTCTTKGERHLYRDARAVTALRTRTRVFTREQAYRHVLAHRFDLYTSRGGQLAWLEAVEQDGTQYVRTAPDHTGADNLLNLPDP